MVDEPEAKGVENKEVVSVPGLGSVGEPDEGPKANRRRQPGVRNQKQDAVDPGADLERRIARVEFAEGALVRLRVPVRADADPGRDILTDLDIVALDIDFRLRLSRSIIESKSGKGQAKEPDRLLWLAGLRDYVNADRAALVRQTVSRRGREVAQRLGIEVQDIPTLQKFERAHAWLPDRFGHIAGVACSEAESRTDTQLKGLAHLPGSLVSYLRNEALLGAPGMTLSALASLSESVRDGDPFPDPTGMVIAGHSLVSLLVAAIAHAQRLDFVPVEQLQREIELSLTVGDPTDDHILKILASADEVMLHIIDQIHQQYVDSGARRRSVAIPSLKRLVSEVPRWVPRYIDFLEAMRANPVVARDLPQTAELACFDALLGDENYRAPSFDHLFTPEHRQMLRVAVRTLREIAGPVVADRLAGLSSIDFDRTAPALPDRRSRLSPGAGERSLPLDGPGDPLGD